MATPKKSSKDETESTNIHCRLGDILEARGMSLTQLSREVGISVTNLSLLKNNHVRAIRYSTLEALCEVLECQPGDLLAYRKRG